MPMIRVVGYTIALVASSSAAFVGRRGQAFLGNGMQPEVVARTLSNVEDEWKAQAAVYVECNGTVGNSGTSIVNCADAPNSFEKSCSTVVSAIIQGSGGDRDVAKEYMTDVCAQSILSGWHQQQCTSLTDAVKGTMTADTYENRMNFNADKLCNDFWSHFLGQEKKRVAEETTAREAAEKKAADQAAEKERARQEELKNEAAERERITQQEHEKEAELKKEEEAKLKAAEAAESAARLAEKKAEAEAVAEAARRKKEEAEAAEQEHTKAMANLTAVKESKDHVASSTKDEAVVAKEVKSPKQTAASKGSEEMEKSSPVKEVDAKPVPSGEVVAEPSVPKKETPVVKTSKKVGEQILKNVTANAQKTPQ